MKLVLKDNTKVDVTSARISDGYFGTDGARTIISITGEKAREVDDAKLKAIFSNKDNIAEVRIITEYNGIERDNGKVYKFASLVDYARIINDYEERVDIMFDQDVEVI